MISILSYLSVNYKHAEQHRPCIIEKGQKTYTEVPLALACAADAEGAAKNAQVRKKRTIEIKEPPMV